MIQNGIVTINKLDKNNKIIKSISEPMHSLTKYALDLWGILFDPYHLVENSTRLRDNVIIDVNGNQGSNSNNILVGFGADGTEGFNHSNNQNEAKGIVIGTDNTAWNINDYKLGKICTFGSDNIIANYHTDLGIPSDSSNPLDGKWNSTDGTYDLSIKRTFTNDSGANININEIGLYMNGKFSDLGNSYNYNFRTLCIIRDVLNSTFVFNSNDTIEVIYTFKFNPKVNKNMIMLFMGQFWAINSNLCQIKRLNDDGTVYGTGYINEINRYDEGLQLRCSTSTSNSDGTMIYNDNSNLSGDVRPLYLKNNYAFSNSYGIVVGYDERSSLTQELFTNDNTDIVDSSYRHTNIYNYPMSLTNVNIGFNFVENNEYTTFKESRLFTNTTTSNITINYVALLATQYRGYSGAYKQYLMYKELLDSEVTLEPGDSFYYEFVYQAEVH